MKTFLIDQLTAPLAPSVATVGFFDGVHRGHQHLLRFLLRQARAEGLESMAVTFDLHPRQVLGADYQPYLLTSLQEKLQLLEQTDLDHIGVLHFTRELAKLSAYDFMKQILRDRLNVRHLIIGYDNRFGHNRSEGFADYARYGRELGMKVEQCDDLVVDGQPVSSTIVRHHVEAGDMEAAQRCLGRPFTLEGKVVHGREEGRRLGFPTANLELSEPDLLLPRRGVYAVKVSGLGYGMMNIGTRPTFDNGQVSIEVNIFGCEGNFYGQQLSVEVLHYIRPERRFGSEEELAQQLERDKENVEKFIGILKTQDLRLKTKD